MPTDEQRCSSLGASQVLLHEVLPVPWSHYFPIHLPADLSQLASRPALWQDSQIPPILATCEWPMELLIQGVAPIRVSALRFMQASASCTFRDGRHLDDLVIGIISGGTRPWELPPVGLLATSMKFLLLGTSRICPWYGQRITEGCGVCKLLWRNSESTCLAWRF